MRRVLLSRNRVDFVTALLQHERLADMMMMQHFASQEPQTPRVSNAAEGSSGSNNNNNNNNDSSGNKTSAGEAFSRQGLLAKLDAVRAKAMKTPSAGWLADAYGEKEWCALSQSRAMVRAVVAADDSTRVKLRGTFFALAQEGGTPPASVRLMACKEDGEALMLTVPLAQGGEKISSTVCGSGIRAVSLTEAEGSVVSDAAVSVDAFAAEQNIIAAAVSSGILGKLEEICALHATHTVRYDALLVRNPAVQKRLSQLACARFSLEALGSFVSSAAASEPLPLVESITLGMHAKSALAKGIQNARDIIDGTTTATAEPHRSNSARLIDYPYVREVFDSERNIIAGLGAATATEVLHHFTPLLAHTHAQSQLQGGGIEASIVARLLGGNGGGVTLAGPHVNLRVSSAALEKDIGAMLQRIKQQKHRDPPFVMATAYYAAEVFANLAVIYRTTAALDRNDDTAAREWLLAQAFCADSAAQRECILREWEMASAVRRGLGRTADLGDCTTHPVELMNAAPVQKAKSPQATATTTATAARATEKAN